MARWDERGTGYGADDNRDRWGDDDRERSSWRSGGQGTSERADERGFFQRAGDEIRSWFEDDDRAPGRDYERGNYGSRSSWDRDDYNRSGSSGGGWSGGSSFDRPAGYSNRDRERSYGRTGRGGSGYSNEDRSSFGGMAQGGQYGRWSSDRDRGYGSSRGGGSWNLSSDRNRFGSSRRDFGGFRSEGDFRGQRHRDHPQSWGEANRGENESLGYGEYSGSLGGFGNQTVGISEHDHYRNWRDRQMSQLDNDYAEYCREREQQFNQDFDSWRRSRQAASTASTGDLGASSNAGVGTTTSSMTGTAGAGSASGSATTQGGTIQSGGTASNETADAGPSGSSRSRSRS
jgi:hypothetical protein